MVGASSRNASHDGPPAEASLERGAKRDTTPSRVPQLLRLLRHLAVLVVTLACAGIASPERARASLTEAATESASTPRVGSRPETFHHLRDGAPRRAVELGDLESDLDDGDTHCDVAEDPAQAFSGASFPRSPCRAWRGEPQHHAMRFAISTGLPRGPPT